MKGNDCHHSNQINSFTNHSPSNLGDQVQYDAEQYRSTPKKEHSKIVPFSPKTPMNHISSPNSLIQCRISQPSSDS